MRTALPARLRSLAAPRSWAPALLLACAACELGHVAPDEGRGVLLIAIDALRADHLGHLGYDRDTSPALDRLAAEGVSFTQAFSAAPWPLPAHVPLFTGCDPNVARRFKPEGVLTTMVSTWNIPEDAPSMAREFLFRGYSTAAFPDHPWVAPIHGFNSGFETFRTSRNDQTTRLRDVGIQGTGEALIGWLRSLDVDDNWFAYLHLHDLGRVWDGSDPRWDTYFERRESLSAVPPVGLGDHLFFAVPHSKWSGGVSSLGDYEARYDGAIRRMDEALDGLFKRLRRLDRWKNTTVVVVGTCGMGFGESGLMLTSGTLSEVDLHVPLILRPAVSLRAARDGHEQGSIGVVVDRRAEVLVSTLDVVPTLLDLHGLEVPEAVQGRSLLGVLRDLESVPRGLAFASCGILEGFAAIHARHTLETRRPYSEEHRGLSTSWYGDHLPHPNDYWEELRDRSGSRPLAVDPADEGAAELAATLRSAAREWFEGVHRARDTLQERGWLERDAEKRMAPDPELWELAEGRQ